MCSLCKVFAAYVTIASCLPAIVESMTPVCPPACGHLNYSAATPLAAAIALIAVVASAVTWHTMARGV